MTRYYICEGTPNGKYNATNKAREDVETVLKGLDFKPLYVDTKYGVSESKLGKFNQARIYAMNARAWKKSLSQLKSGDIVVVQHPLTNTTLFMDKVLDNFKKHGITTILQIHDVDSFRYPSRKGSSYYSRIHREDNTMINGATYVISHNSIMSKQLTKEFNAKPDKLVNLGIFDYVLDAKTPVHQSKEKNTIAIAGNLSPDKAGYIANLNKIKDVTFNLFGKSSTPLSEQKNTKLCGSFDANNPPAELANCGFGLVWDGNSIDGCSGDFGKYLKINNPHKASLYLSLGLPVIVPEGSAIAKFVESQKVGFSVKSLSEIPAKLKKLSDKDYADMVKSAKSLGKNLRSGNYLTSAINTIFDSISAGFCQD